MKVLGIYGSIGFDGSQRESYIHDASATLFINGEHICSIQEERLSGLKYDGRYPEKSIDYVLDEVKKEEIDLVIFVDIGLQDWVRDLTQGNPNKFLQEIFPKGESKTRVLEVRLFKRSLTQKNRKTIEIPWKSTFPH